ncbi:hypothetical protein F7725_018502, partial [Dissostichus mawsoni]
MPSMPDYIQLQYRVANAFGKDLEEKKGPFENTQLDVTHPGVNNFRLSGEGKEDIRISKDGWLYLEKPLDWSQDDHYMLMVEALADEEVVDGPVYVTINVVDVNNNAPYFNQSTYTAVVRENSPTETPNAHLSYSLVSQIPQNHQVPLFQVDPHTGEISTTEAGEKMLKAREGIHYGRGEDRSSDALRTKFDDYCPVQNIPYEENPFFTCDLGGASETALSGNAIMHIVVQQNLWVNPGPITIKEHLKESYPKVIAKVQSNEPNAIYKLVQKERELKFPFQITEDGEIHLTEELDREDKDMYILVVFAVDENEQQADPPMEIQVLVEDVNDNAPVCENMETEFEVQEDEPEGSLIGLLLAHDDDQAGTINTFLTYTILSQIPATSPNAFAIDAASGRIQALRPLQRKKPPSYSTECKVVVKVIDVNNEKPLFEKTNYGTQSLSEDIPVGHTVLSIKATDADDPTAAARSSSSTSQLEMMKTDGQGVGHVVVSKPLDFESSATYKLQIDARNTEPLMKGLEYGSESTTFITVSLSDVDEAPEFSQDILDVTVPENTTKGSVLLTVEAKDPEGKEIRLRWTGWLEIDAATGEIKTKGKLDRETLESFEVTVTAFEKENPEKSSERVVSVRLLDVNDNFPKLTEKQAFICVKKAKPVIIKAEDADSAPFSQPFTFAFAHGKKSPNWELKSVDGSSAALTLRKSPSEDKTFVIPISIKDSAGLGVTQSFEVRVCNCTELGYCYMAPVERNLGYGMGPTIGILAGVLGFCLIVFVIVIKRNNKGNKKRNLNE